MHASGPKTLSDFRRLGKRKLAPRTAEQAKELHDARQDAKYTVTVRAAKRCIPLGGACQDLIDAVKDDNPHKKNWDDAKAASKICVAAGMHVNDHGRYSSRCKYTHYTYTVLVRSWGVVLPTTNTLAVKIGANKLRAIRAPRGYRWDADANGIRLVSLAAPSADYHPTASDLLQGTRFCVQQLQANRKARWQAEQERRQAAKDAAQTKRILAKAESEGLAVCLRDSLRAGNCEAGTRTWASRHGFQADRHYTPSQLLAQANGDAQKVSLVVAVALRRHRAEMARGYAELSDHR